jgi:hypothetical protein
MAEAGAETERGDRGGMDGFGLELGELVLE